MAGETFPIERHGDAIRILVVDGSLMGNQLLAEALDRNQGFFVVGTAETPDTALAAVRNSVDVVVVSANLAEAAPSENLTRRLLAARPGLRVLVLLERPERNAVVEAFRAGASGIFCRAEPLERLWKCIESVHRGKVWASDEALKFVIEELASSPPVRVVDGGNVCSLTEREQKIVCLVAEGLTNRQIAVQLGLNEHTLKSSLQHLFDKLDVSSRAEMVFAASVLTEASDPVALEMRAGRVSNSRVQFESYARAAACGFPFAQLTAGRMCFEGRGTSKDHVAAYAWLLLAEENANEVVERSSAYRQSLTSIMSEEEVAEAEQRASRSRKRPAGGCLLAGGEGRAKRHKAAIDKGGAVPTKVTLLA